MNWQKIIDAIMATGMKQRAIAIIASIIFCHFTRSSISRAFGSFPVTSDPRNPGTYVISHTPYSSIIFIYPPACIGYYLCEANSQTPHLCSRTLYFYLRNVKRGYLLASLTLINVCVYWGV